MIAPHAIQRHPSNAQPRLRVLHSGCRRACWAMMMRQARRSSAIQHYTVRCGFLSQRSYVAPSRQRRSSSKRPRKELTYCPIYGFKSFLICAKELTPALFCYSFVQYLQIIIIFTYGSFPAIRPVTGRRPRRFSLFMNIFS